jgi:hypothetical protein
MTSDFIKFHESLLDLVQSFKKKNIVVNLRSDPDSNIVRIYGERFDNVTLAKAGLEEIEELAFTAAEHHPYWSILYNGTQILKIVLEKWDDKLTEDEIKEILWYVDTIKNSSGNVVFHTHDQ